MTPIVVFDLDEVLLGGDAIACLRRHRADGDHVVVATGCEEPLARGFLTAGGLGDVDVVGSIGSLPPLRIRRGRPPSGDAHLALGAASREPS